MVNNLSGMYVLGTLIFALFARGEVQPFNSVSFNQGDIMLNIGGFWLQETLCAARRLQ